MKKILVATVSAVLCVLLLSNCNKREEPRSAAQCPQCKAYDRSSFKGIRYQTAWDMVQNYLAEDSPAVAVWFSLETLKGFIYQIESATCNTGCDPLKLGVRIYYARYPDNFSRYVDLSDLSATHARYARRRTLFMVPTYDDRQRIHWDFDPWNVGSNPCKPIKLCDINVGQVQGPPAPFGAMMLAIRSDTDPDKTLNHGDLIPPDYHYSAAFLPRSPR